MRKNILFFVILLFIFILAFFVRVYFCYDKVLSNPIKYAADDGIYHMRLVENELLGGHFPHRIYFDPFTYFPYGTYIHFTPLYDQLLAGIIWMIGLGHSSLELINKIAPFYPVVLGSLVVFLIYFVSRALWGVKTALFSAFLMAISQPYLFRSLLGATDHHAGEVFFSSLTMMFLIFTLKEKNSDYSGKTETSPQRFNIKNHIKDNYKFYLLTFLSGLSLGLYFLTWSGAILFLFIIFAFIVLYFLIEFVLGNNYYWILLMGSIISFIALAMIAPFFGHPNLIIAPMYNIQHLGILISSIAGFAIIGCLSVFFVKRKIERKLFPLFLIILALVAVFILNIVFPSFFKEILKTIQMVNTGISPNKLARELTGEMKPLSLSMAIGSFGPLFYLSLVALVLVFYKFIKKKRPEYLLIFIWSIVITLMTGIIPLFGQNRIIYYLSFNVSLLSGFLIVKGFEFGWRSLKIAEGTPLNPAIRPYFLIGSLFIVFNVVFFLFFPFPFNIGDPFPNNLPAIFRVPFESAKQGPPMQSADWYEAMQWLKDNTPDPGVDYYALYKEPGVDQATGKIIPFSYPKSAYGILARWDVGHMITYYAHRIPNANPFHQGVGEKENGKTVEIGEATFFIETDEKKATEYLDDLRTKYVITDYPDPDGIFGYKVKWLQGDMQGYDEDSAPAIGPTKYDSSIMVRLHLFDGRGETISQKINGEEKEFFIEPLEHFRLIHESKNTIALYKKDPEKEIKEIKIFEYVKGAKIQGTVKPGTKVTISTEITTNQNRKFIYQKDFQSKDSSFEFVVPYSTSQKVGLAFDQNKNNVSVAPYKLKIGEKEIEVRVSESDILEGKTIQVN